MLSGRAQRIINLARAGDTGRLPGSQVEYDFSTDSWSQLNQPYMAARGELLAQRAQAQPLALHETLSRQLPFDHFIATPRGRDAEALLFSAMARRRPGTVAQNILFHTARAHQQQRGLIPLELPVENAFAHDAFPFKANLDLDKLAALLARQPVSLIFIEALSNGVGGYPISMENLRAVQALARTHGVPLYMDATRAVENGLLIREFDPEFQGCELSAVMQALYACCDGVTISLVKDYGLTEGGLLATRCAALHAQAQAEAVARNLLLAEPAQARLAHAVCDWAWVEEQVQQRIHAVRALSEGLKLTGFPLRVPPGAHCVILDVSLLPENRENPLSADSFLARLYEDHGIRGAKHWDGLAPEYRRPGWIRLAVPLGCPYVEELLDSFPCRVGSGLMHE